MAGSGDRLGLRLRLREIGFREIGFREIGFREIGFREIGFREIGFRLRLGLRISGGRFLGRSGFGCGANQRLLAPYNPERGTPMAGADDIRRAASDDAELIADLYARTLRDAYGGLMPAEFSDPVSVEQRAAKIRHSIVAGTRIWFVAFANGTLLGFCGLSPARDTDVGDGVAEITVIAVESNSRREGYGRALLGAARREAIERGWGVLVLWVVTRNVDAREFYARDDWTPDGAAKVDNRLGFPAPVVRYRARVRAE